MNRLNLLLLGMACMILLCSGVKRVERNRPCVTTTPEKLQLFVNQQTDPYTIQVNYTLNIPADYMPSCARMIWQPYFIAAGNRYNLTPLIIVGRGYSRQEKRLEALTDKEPDYPDAMYLVSNGDGMKIKLSATVPFQLWMPDAKLRATVSVEACDREVDLHDLTLAIGVIYLPLGPGPVILPDDGNILINRSRDF